MPLDVRRGRPLATILSTVFAVVGIVDDGLAQSGQRTAEPSFFTRAGDEARSKHYRILSDLGPDDTRIYARHLDIFYAEFARRLAHLPIQAPEVPFVLMFARERDYLDTLRNTYGINATGSGGMFFMSPKGAALAFFVESLPRTRVFHVIQHEGFHQYAFSRFATTLPPWVNEGLAECFGEAVVVDGRVIIGQASPAPVVAIQRAIHQGTTIDFLRMLTMSSDDWNGNVRAGSAGIQYTQAWSMVQFLGWAEGGRYQKSFEGYLQLLHAGVPSDRAFVQAFGSADVAGFEQRWKEWARKTQPTAFATAVLRIGYLAEGLRSLSVAGIAVESLDDLVAKLRERQFTIAITVHGRTESMTADELVLEIPKDELAKSKPVFELRPAKLSMQTARDRNNEEAHPTPPIIVTRGLAPRELLLKWTRSKAGDDFEFELLSPKEAPAAPKARRKADKQKEENDTDTADSPTLKPSASRSDVHHQLVCP